MKKQLSPAVIAGVLLVAVLVIGFFIFRAAQPAPTPHPDPSRFMPHAATLPPAAPGAH
jgi:hypothetical protein